MRVPPGATRPDYSAWRPLSRSRQGGDRRQKDCQGHRRDRSVRAQETGLDGGCHGTIRCSTSPSDHGQGLAASVSPTDLELSEASGSWRPMRASHSSVEQGAIAEATSPCRPQSGKRLRRRAADAVTQPQELDFTAMGWERFGGRSPGRRGCLMTARARRRSRARRAELPVNTIYHGGGLGKSEDPGETVRRAVWR